MNIKLTFDDVLLRPQFSTIESRKDVSLEQNFLGINTTLPIISANMDTVTGFEMCQAMRKNGGIGALHRFNSGKDNVDEFLKCPKETFVSIGLGDSEFDRAMALAEVGARYFIIDVAHAASSATVNMYIKLRQNLPKTSKIIVGNFADKESIYKFCDELDDLLDCLPDAIKVGIGGGSLCTTRIVTGSGYPTLASIMDCKGLNIPIIADGGMRTSGDIAKALAAGASMVMLGGMLAGTEETPGESYFNGYPCISYQEARKYIGAYQFPYDGSLIFTATGSKAVTDKPNQKKYRGSASKESYEIQGKESNWRTPEGESTFISYKGPVSGILQQIEAGLRSALTYSGARDLIEFRNKAEFIQITSAGVIESGAHGKSN